MVVVDVIVVTALLLAFLTGVQRGLFANLGVMVGFAVGGLAAYALVPLLVPKLPLPGWRGVAAAALAAVLLIAGTALGGIIGHVARAGVDRTALRGAERLLGGLATLVVTALVLSFTASTLTLTASPGVSAAIGSSRVLRVIDDLTPAPVSAGMAGLRSSLLDDGLPRFGEIVQSDAVGPLDPLDVDDPELREAAASVARITGTAYACGRTVTGSGFAVAGDRVVTNAHVVAGVETPLVELPGGIAAEGRVVYFDPAVDIAVVAVDGLTAVPLALSGDVEAGTALAVQGYPYGGPLTTIDAQVLSRGLVQVPDIYGASTSPRDVYSLATQVRPGNSGGPLLTGDGTVAGLVFARGENDAARGYAITDALLGPVTAQAEGLVDTVDTGECAG